ncbi:MAG: ferritin [bacterium]
MKLSAKLTESVNAQIGREFFASIQYVAMAAWFEEQGLPGFAKYFYKQATEENEHALKFVRYVAEVDAQVAIPAIPEPRRGWSTVQDVLRAYLEAEEDVTRRIWAIAETAQAEKDLSTLEFVQWFVAEQREEESSARSLLDRAKRLGEERVALLDATLGGE